MKTVRHEPMRKEELTKDQWFEVARRDDPGLTRTEFNLKWPQFCRFLETLQNSHIIEYRLNG